MPNLDINWLTSERGRKFALSARKASPNAQRLEDDNDRIQYANQSCPVLYLQGPNGRRQYLMRYQPLNSQWPEYRLILTPQQVQEYLDRL